MFKFLPFFFEYFKSILFFSFSFFSEFTTIVLFGGTQKGLSTYFNYPLYFTLTNEPDLQRSLS